MTPSRKASRRVALYARYSTDMQNPMSIEDQYRIVERYAQQRGWIVVARFSDSAISGSMSLSRPGFQELSDALPSKAFEVVLAESLDRLSRDQEHAARFYKAAKQSKVDIYTPARGRVDAMTLGLSSTMNAIFLEDLADKTRRGLEGRVAKGFSGGGRVYGYTQGTDEGRAPIKGALAIDGIEAAVVRRIFRDYAAGRSPIAIASALNDDGIPSPSVGTERASSGHWKQNTINGNRARGTGILNNELYIGRRVWNRLSYGKDYQTEKRRSTLNPESEWRRVEVPGLRIVDQDLWDAVKARQESQAKRRSKVASTDPHHLSSGQSLRRRKYLLSGLLHCGLCGGKMTVAGSGRYKAYYCADAKEKGKSVCEGFRGLKEARASELVLSALRSELMQPQAYEAFRESFRKHLVQSQGAAEDTLRLHDARVRDLETRHRNLLQAVETGDFAAAIVERLSAVDAELKEMKGKRGQIVPPTVELPGNLAAALSDEAVAGRSADELHELVERVDVHWDDAAAGHRLEVSGSLLEMLRKSAPSKLDAVRGDIFAEVGCGSRI